MSLYYVQKFLYHLNRDTRLQEKFLSEPETVLVDYTLTDEERTAILTPDIGLLYVLGVNGQILMHYAALHKYPWPDYLESMREGVRQHGPVREGIYAMTGTADAVAANSNNTKERT